jgi:hypothetical protein
MQSLPLNSYLFQNEKEKKVNLVKADQKGVIKLDFVWTQISQL